MQDASKLPVMFYSLSISGRSAKANVKTLSRDLEDKAGASSGTVTTLVTRIPDQWAQPIKSTESSIRNLFKKNAIQMGEYFAVPIKTLPKFESELTTLRQAYSVYFANLVRDTENGELAKVLAMQSGSNIDKIKVPTLEEIESGYGIKIYQKADLESESVKSAMATLTEELREHMRKSVEESEKAVNAERLGAVTSLIVGTVKEFVNDVKTRCSSKDTKGLHFKSMIDRIEHIVNVLPDFNVTENQALSDLIASVKEKFSHLDKDVLKEDENARKEAIEDVNEITTTFANLF